MKSGSKINSCKFILFFKNYLKSFLKSLFFTEIDIYKFSHEI